MIQELEPRLVKFLTVTCGVLSCGCGAYWLLLCSGEHWMKAISPLDLIFPVLHIVISFSSLFFITSFLKHIYVTNAVMSVIPGLIVCFVNRASRFPDCKELIETFNSGHEADPIARRWPPSTRSPSSSTSTSSAGLRTRRSSSWPYSSFGW
jgi:hypothetical protein